MTTPARPKQVWAPMWATHPGEHLLEHIEARGWSQAELARLAGLSPELVSAIIGGINPVTAETAVKLERVLGVKAYIWTSIQTKWDRFQASQRAKRAMDEDSRVG